MATTLAARPDGVTESASPEAAGSAPSTGLLFVAQIAAAAGAFLTTVIIARTLGPSGRGVYAFAVTVAGLVAIVGQLGLSSAVSFAAAQSQSGRRYLRRFYLLHAGTGSLLLGLAISALMAARHDLMPKILHGHGIAILIGPIALAITVFDGAYGFRSSAQRYRQAAVMLALGGIAPALVVLVLDLAGILSPAGALGAWGAVRIAIGLAGWYRPRLGGSGASDPALSRSLRSYGRRAFAASAAGIVTLRADQWVLGLMAGGATLGVYAVAVSLTDPALYLPSALQRVLFPRVVGQAERAVELTARAIRISVALVAVFVGVAAPIGFALLPLVFGHGFTASRTPFLVLLPGVFGITILILASASISAVGRPGIASVVEIGTSAGMLLLDVALIPPLGATGAAIACTSAYTAGGLCAVVAFARIHPGSRLALIPRADDLRTIAVFVRRRLGGRP